MSGENNADTAEDAASRGRPVPTGGGSSAPGRATLVAGIALALLSVALTFTVPLTSGWLFAGILAVQILAIAAAGACIGLALQRMHHGVRGDTNSCLTELGPAAD